MVSTKNSVDKVLNDRTVIPSWKSPQNIVEIPSFDPARLLRRENLGKLWVKHQTAIFKQFPSPNTANELYETAALYGCEEGLSSAVRELSMGLQENIIRSHQIVFPSNNSVLAHTGKAQLEIHRIRRLLAINPDRPLCWSELSRNYLAVAEKDKAIKCMQAALKLAKHNRYIFRVAARLFVHTKEYERARALFKSEPSVKIDPWLLAAEIATLSAFSKQSRYINVAKQLMTSSHFKDNQISELAAAVGTVELINGASKQAKLFFNRSLIAPTGNSLAQAQWAIEQDAKIIIPSSAWNTPAAYEAVTLASRRAHKWDNALDACVTWLAEEPFSIRPAVLGSYIGFRPEHVEIAEQFASVGLKCYPKNILLLNNRAVANAYQGKIKEAYTDVQIALTQPDGRDEPYLLATLGLIAFRSGMPALGREYYELCMGWFKQIKAITSYASALLFLLREEIQIDRSVIPHAIDMAQQIGKSPIVIGRPELVGLIELILKEADIAINTNHTPSNNKDGTGPISINKFRNLASLFNIPKNSKQFFSYNEDYSTFNKSF